jgi:hypothetical protein
LAILQRRSDWKNNLELKLFTEQEKYRVDNIINQSNEVIKDFEVNVQSKKKKFALISTSLLKLRLTTSLAY